MIWWKAGFVHLAWNSFLPIGFMVVSQFFTYFRIFPYFSFYRFLLNTLWQAAPETLQRLGQSNMSADYFLWYPFCISSIRMSTFVAGSLQGLFLISFSLRMHFVLHKCGSCEVAFSLQVQHLIYLLCIPAGLQKMNTEMWRSPMFGRWRVSICPTTWCVQGCFFKWRTCVWECCNDEVKGTINAEQEYIYIYRYIVEA